MASAPRAPSARAASIGWSPSPRSVFSSWPKTSLRFVPPGADLRWMDAISETRATCADCVRCRPGSSPRFHEASKCCTHVPFIPNYAVGEILRAGGEGARAAKERANSIAAWPLGLRPWPTEERAERERGPELFGVDARVVCPFLRGGSCSAWESRPSPCASYFCETSHFDNDRSLWRRARDYFHFVETTLAAEVLAQKGFLEDEISACWAWLPRENRSEREFDEGAQREVWLEFGRDREGFFRDAAEIVEGLSPSAIWELMGEQGERLWRDVEGVGRATARIAAETGA